LIRALKVAFKKNYFLHSSHEKKNFSSFIFGAAQTIRKASLTHCMEHALAK
jgi:hypothetical protein